VNDLDVQRAGDVCGGTSINSYLVRHEGKEAGQNDDSCFAFSASGSNLCEVAMT
jgi:hypothetical protein